MRGFAPTTVRGYSSLLNRVLGRFDCPVWAVDADDVDEMLHALAVAGLAPGTRRQYLQMLRAFHAFVAERYGAQVRSVFGVPMGDGGLDRFNRVRHAGDDSPTGAPPGRERLQAFFSFVRSQVAVGADYRVMARDYALLRTPYHSAVRVNELVCLDQQDVHLHLGPSGKLHVRFGKAANTSGPRPRWAPMLEGLDRILAWYLQDVRPLFPATAPLFCDEDGQALKADTVRDRLARLLDLEGAGGGERFTPHALRRACATHHYERGMDLLAVQQLLGHRHIASTMAYVKPSQKFIEDAWRRATDLAVRTLAG
ncbi:tyrosine-type recombinase/integrase [Streptomyces vietnamensis]|uniref:tyrosine-type recombinase/integrase n=1 Tax=Streptomyces vietnamensis TaxID=362257 RepID=UPI001FDF834C|nr:site-specific integrase [Streptomyces vietnamensis]